MTGGELLPRLHTGIPGFDEITSGGLPAGEVTLVAGTTGSGKTVLGMHFLACGIQQFDEAGVLVTFAEPVARLRRFVMEFGWDLDGWEERGRWAFVEATTGLTGGGVVIGENFDFTVLVARIAAAVERVGARRVVLDSLSELFARFGDRTAVRDNLQQIIRGLEEMGVTAIAIVGRQEDYGAISSFGVEEYLTDNVVIVRNSLIDESRRRTIEILKLRGTTHRRGEFPFAITREEGLVVIPLSLELRQPAGDARLSTGNDVLDAMAGGGFFRDGIILVSGATGSGKTTLALQFALAGIDAGETAVIVGFEESTNQLSRNIRTWGYDLVELEEHNRIRVIIDYPEVRSFEEHLVRLKTAIDDVGAKRVCVDSLTTLRRAGSERSYREYVIGLTAYLREREVAGLLTTTVSALWDSISATEANISALCDALVVLRYVEVFGEVRRGIMVLKNRGSQHEKSIREFTVDADGLHVGAPLRTTTGILSGRAANLAADEHADMGERYPQHAAPPEGGPAQ